MATITYDTELMHSAVPGPNNQTTEITSYTINIRVLDASDFPLSSGGVVIGASPSTAAVVNGVNSQVTSPGSWYALDSNGSVTLIVSTPSITSSNFWVSNARDSKHTPVPLNPSTGVILNPSHKVITAFSAINEHTDLTKLQGQSGKPLWPPGAPRPSEDDLKQAHSVFQNAGQMLNDVHVNIPTMNAQAILQAFRPANPLLAVEAIQRNQQLAIANMQRMFASQHQQGQPPRPLHVQANSSPHIEAKFSLRGALGSLGGDIRHGGEDVGHGIEKGGEDAGHGIEKGGEGAAHGIEYGTHKIGSGLDSLDNDITGGAAFIGHGFESGLKDVKDFTVKKTSDAWHFVYHTVNEAKDFIIETIQDLGAVLDFVWGKLKLGIEELIDFAGFLFEWDDIRDTSSYIKGILNGLLQYGAAEVGQLESKVNGLFTNLKAKVGERLTHHADTVGQLSTANTKSQSQLHGPQIATSPSLNFLNERYQNGGVQGASMQSGPPPTRTNNSQFSQSVMPFKSRMETDLKSIGKDLSSLFHSTKSLRSPDIWEKLANDTVDGLLDVVNGVIQAFLRALQEVIIDLQRLCDAGIHIPMISDLLKLKGLGDLSAFDLVSTLLGFMVVVFYKLIKHQRFKLPSEPPQAVVEKLFSGDVLAIDKAVVSMLEAMASFGVTLVMRIRTTIKIAKALAEQGPQGGSAAAAPSTITGPVGPKSVPTLIGAAAKLLSSAMSLRGDKTAPGYDFTHAASCLSFVSTVVQTIYNLSATGLPEEVQAIEEFFFVIALINFILYDGAAAQMSIAAAADPRNREKYSLAAEQCATENLCNTVASCGQYVGMVTAMGVDEAIEAGPEVELAEVVAVVGFAVYLGGNDALLVNKAINLVTSIETDADDIRGVAPNA